MIVVYGGTFNPPTIAHQEIAKVVIEKFKPDKFILLPVGDHYTWKDSFVSFDHRKRMLELAFPNEITQVSMIEKEKVYKGTYQSLLTIKNTYNKEVYFLLGADNIDYLEQWINYQKLISEFHFIVLERPGFEVWKIIDEKFYKYRDRFKIVKLDIHISASMFRDNPDNFEIIPHEVYEYIKENELYGVKKHV